MGVHVVETDVFEFKFSNFDISKTKLYTLFISVVKC